MSQSKPVKTQTTWANIVCQRPRPLSASASVPATATAPVPTPAPVPASAPITTLDDVIDYARERLRSGKSLITCGRGIVDLFPPSVRDQMTDLQKKVVACLVKLADSKESIQVFHWARLAAFGFNDLVEERSKITGTNFDEWLQPLSSFDNYYGSITPDIELCRYWWKVLYLVQHGHATVDDVAEFIIRWRREREEESRARELAQQKEREKEREKKLNDEALLLMEDLVRLTKKMQELELAIVNKRKEVKQLSRKFASLVMQNDGCELSEEEDDAFDEIDEAKQALDGLCDEKREIEHEVQQTERELAEVEKKRTA
jgi:hypothetical protein